MWAKITFSLWVCPLKLLSFVCLTHYGFFLTFCLSLSWFIVIPSCHYSFRPSSHGSFTFLSFSVAILLPSLLLISFSLRVSLSTPNYNILCGEQSFCSVGLRQPLLTQAFFHPSHVIFDLLYDMARHSRVSQITLVDISSPSGYYYYYLR